MAGVAGFEPTMLESKSSALPLGDTPTNGVEGESRTHDLRDHNPAL